MTDSLFYLRTELWPAFGHYNAGKVSPLALLAFHINVLTHKGNLLKDSGKDDYFFRDSLPAPRPATYSAWNALLGLGNADSPLFYCPFLPAIREDEEGGVASSLRGAGHAGTNHISTLTRRSKLHLRNQKGMIEWGSIYIGSVDQPEGSPLVAKVNRSDIAETYVVPRCNQVPGEDYRASGGLRTRMEFLAAHGIPGVNLSGIPLRPVRRVLFQLSTHESAHGFARAYQSAARIVAADEGAAESDYRAFIEETQEAMRPAKDKDGQESDEMGKKEQKKNKKRFLPDIDLTL